MAGRIASERSPKDRLFLSFGIPVKLRGLLCLKTCELISFHFFFLETPSSSNSTKRNESSRGSNLLCFPVPLLSNISVFDVYTSEHVKIVILLAQQVS